MSGGAQAVGHVTHRSLRPFLFSRLRTALDPSLSALLAAKKPIPRRPQRPPTADQVHLPLSVRWPFCSIPQQGMGGVCHAECTQTRFSLNAESSWPAVVEALDQSDLVTIECALVRVNAQRRSPRKCQ